MRRTSRAATAAATAALTAIGLVGVAGAAAPAVATAAAAGGGQQRADGPVVQTDKGAVRGEQKQGYRTFEGIPFAAPPVGERRFRPPAPTQPWEDALDATAPRSQCAQLTRLTNPETFGEDCLYLNVTAPPEGPAGKPVMVWIHGGAFVYGTGANYDAGKLATQGDVVVVTINYRLGPLGFLADPALSDERPAAGSGDYALLDQQAALRWVQRNAEAFGGDPDNVTVFGESAGASSVCAQLVSPTAAGLFDRAIAQSYSCSEPYVPQQDAEQTGRQVAEAVGCDAAADVAVCLREVPAEDLLRAWPGGAFNVGGRSLPLQPGEALATDRYNHVRSVMHGNTRDENRLFTPLEHGTSITRERYLEIVRELYGEDADEVLQRYPATVYSPIIALSTLTSQAGTRLSTCEHVQAYDLLSDPPRATATYAYQFRDRTSSPLVDFPGLDEGAAHAQELPFLFPGLFGKPLDAAQQALSDTMVAYWTNFARSGDPDDASTPDWDRYRHGSGVVQGLDTTKRQGVRPVDVADESRCAFFARIGR